MRQIHFCAWLLVTSVALAACGGEKFTTSGPSGAGTEAPVATSNGGSAYRSHAGASNAGSSADLAASGSTSDGNSSAGTQSTGGSSTSSGGYASSGAENSGGASSQDCPSGSITFRMLPDAGLASDYLCDAGCGTGWLTITDAEGATAFSISSACGTASCDSCEVQPCAAAACLPTPLTTKGAELVWTGTYLAKDTCGAKMACQKQACVQPGKYKAKACAAINGGSSSMGPGCMPKNELLCAEAEFDFPATSTVKLVLKKP